MFGYIDIREDNDIPFYVGIGDNRRIETYTRNKYHTRIKNKYGLKRIIKQFNSRKEALNWEIETIFQLKQRGIELTNYTSGGEINDYKRTDEHKKLMSSIIQNKVDNGFINGRAKWIYVTPYGECIVLKKLAKQLNVHYQTIVFRCKSKNKLFNDWYLKPIEEKESGSR